MELRVNMSAEPWRYKYKTNIKIDDWYTMEVETPEEDFARWLKLVELAGSTIALLTKSKANNHDREDVIQESWLAYEEMKPQIKKLSRAEFISRFRNAIKKRVVKNNEFGVELTKRQFDRYMARKESLKTVLPTQTEPIEYDEMMDLNIEKYCTPEEYRILLDHVQFGRADKFNLTNSGYSKSIRKLMKRVKDRIVADIGGV